MEQRRIMSLGRSSLVISLPKHWVKLNELKKGDVVSIAVNRDRSLAVFPGVEKKREAKTITLRTDPDEEAVLIVRSIIACYLNGYSKIKLVSNNIFSVAQQKAIRNIVRVLYMRIMEANTKETLIQTLIDESKASVVTGINRMYLLSSSMCHDVFSALKEQHVTRAKAVHSIDDDVDHFSFFLLRLLRSVTVDSVLANQLGLEPIDCLDYQALVQKIEHVADHATNIAKHIIMLNGRNQKITKTLIEPLYNAGVDAIKSYDEAVNAFFSKDVERSNEIIERQKQAEKLDQELASLTFLREKNAPIICASCSIRDSIMRITEYAADIAEITINRFYKIVS
jgi:phosphate uptake regulator